MNAFILLMAAGQGFLLSFALITKKSNNRSGNICFSIILLLISLELLFAWGGISGYNNQKGVFPYWLFLSNLAIPPALWFFFRQNIAPAGRFQPGNLLYFIPSFLEIVVHHLRYYVPGNRSLSALCKSPLWFFYIEWLPLALTLVVLVLLGRDIIALSETFKNAPGTRVKPYLRKMYFLFSFFCLLAALWILVTVYDQRVFIIMEAGFAATCFLAGYFAFFKPEIFDIPKIIAANHKSGHEKMTAEEQAAFARLTRLFEQDRIYTRPKLTVAEVAAELDISEKTVSHLINTYASGGFNDFVNHYRVKAFLTLVKQENNKTILGIAMDAGFNSKTTFYQVFKQVTGKSPSEYLD